MQQEIRLSIKPDGAVVGIYSDDLAGLIDDGTAKIVRASHVEPTADGRWTAEMVGGPVLGPYRLRSEALAAEVDYLKGKLF